MSRCDDLPIRGGDPTCGCCARPGEPVPPRTTNRPRLDALRYRAGTHGTFFAAMVARLSRLSLGRKGEEVQPLRRLSQRSPDDPSIALLDAWAALADILTFYQERIANEGYLRTALERRSLVELGRLIGYAPRPGVAASVHLAFTVDENYEEVEIPAGTRAQSVPVGEGETPQPFESAAALTARAAWNALTPRLERPRDFRRLERGERVTLYLDGTSTNLRPNDPLCVPEHQEAYRVLRVAPDPDAKRTAVEVELWRPPSGDEGDFDPRRGLAPGAVAAPPPEELRARIADAVEPFLDLDAHGVAPGANARKVLEAVEALREEIGRGASAGELAGAVERALDPVRAVHAEARESNWGRIEAWTRGLAEALEEERAALAALPGSPSAASPNVPSSGLSGLLGSLEKAPSVPPASALRLPRSLELAFGVGSQATLELLATVRPRIRSTLYAALGSVVATPAPAVESVEALRVEAAPFGATAPLRPVFDRRGDGEEDGVGNGVVIGHEEWPLAARARNILPLDAVYDEVLPGSCVVVDRPDRLVMARVKTVRTVSRAAFGVTGKVTELTLDQPWLFDVDRTLAVIRETAVYARGERLPLAPAPIDPVAEPVAGGSVELDGLYPGLEPGRWLVFRGERTDVPGAEGVPASELAMIAAVTQGADDGVPGDRRHTTLELAAPLAYAFKRDTVTIYGNVVEATHGESRREVLGSGDGSRAGQSFALSFTPLTHVAATTPEGVESTLGVRVDEVLWHPAPDPAALGPDDRRYLLRTDDDGTTTVTFGDGRHGARLPTGVENVAAEYRQGIGKAANVEADQISQLATQPLGVKGVVNPLPATGGADRDGPETLRRNAPLSVTALDRLVSVADYADFARTFAGVAKADAVVLSDGRRRIVHLTIAGVDDAPIAESSHLLRNLRAAIARFGDPHQPFTVAVRELLLLVVSARVRIGPDHRWESVEPGVRAALLDALAFDRRDLGRDVVSSAVIAAIQSVGGVVATDVDVLDRIEEGVTPEELEGISDSLGLAQRIRVERARIAAAPGEPGMPAVLPAQLAYLSPELPAMLVLTEWTP